MHIYFINSKLKIHTALLSQSLKAQGLIEYALIIILVAMAVIGALTLLGISLPDTYQDIINQLLNT